MRKILYAVILSLFCFSTTFAAERVVNLVIDNKTVHFAGKWTHALAINNQIPGPTLHFKQGDHVTLHVHNKLDQETAVHWHGIILPWQMDGVQGITEQGIPPGGIFHYQFTLHQSGTYWYHAHAGLQEQQGLYGAFLIDSPQPPSYHYDKDFVIVLSDWSNTHPDQILANLKKQGGYYAPRFPLQPSLFKFIHDYKKGSAKERQNILDDYKMMQEMRMSIYDISDIAYDSFLLNGHPATNPWRGKVNVGDVVRLRFIGAGGSTIFHVKTPGQTMQMVHVQGNDIKPFPTNDFTIAPGETYDVLVKIKHSAPTLIYAESADAVGAAIGALVTHPQDVVDTKNLPHFPEPLPVTREMMSMMMSSTSPAQKRPHKKPGHQADSPHSQGMNMGMGMSMDMPTEASIIRDTLSPSRSSVFKTTVGTKYQALQASVKTNDPKKPIYKEINMELFGYMERYIWFVNGVPADKAKPIRLETGKRYRVIFTNNSMMHHPMHIHGHWFILRKGHGAYDPLLHTIDVAPGATITADLDADASGQWFFHCHLLYHMMSGMARVFQYGTLIDITQHQQSPQHIIKETPFRNRPIIRVDKISPIDTSLIHQHSAHPAHLNFASFFELGFSPLENTQKFNFNGLYGWDYHKIELFINDAELKRGTIEAADVDILYWRLINQFWAIKGGVNYYYRPSKKPYWQPAVGLEGLMPYFIDTHIRAYYYNGSIKIDIELSRDTQITHNFFIQTEVRSILASKTINRAQIGSGLNQMRYVLKPYYRITPGLNIFCEYEHEQSYGRFKKILQTEGESITNNTVSLGFSILF